MSRVATGARTAVGAVLAAAFVVGGVAAVATVWPARERPPLSITTIPEPSASLAACTGPVLAVGRDATQAGALSVAGAQAVVAATADGAAPPEERPLAAVDVTGGSGAAAFAAQPENRTRTDLAAAGSTTVADTDLRGFAASACTAPLMESWLVGGSAQTGAADLVVLANPGEVAARVDLTVYGVDGPQTPASGAGIVVAAGTQRIVPLAALALGEQRPVVRVTAAEAPVQASLQTSVTRTLLPGGVDQVGVTSAPATSQVIPAFSVTRAPGDGDATTILRLLAPSADAEATVTITRIGAGAVDIAPQTVALAAGGPLELQLGGLAIGAYTLRVDATAPVVAGVWETTGFAEDADFAWYASADTLDVPSLFAVARGASPTLTITNDGDGPVTAQITAVSGVGEAADIDVPAGGATRYALRPGETYRFVAGGEQVRASVTYAGAGLLAGYTVAPADAAASAIVVFPQ